MNRVICVMYCSRFDFGSDPVTLLKHALLMSGFPEYSLKVKKITSTEDKLVHKYPESRLSLQQAPKKVLSYTSQASGLVGLSRADVHLPPFEASITAGGYLINFKELDLPRKDIPTVLSELILSKLFPGDYDNTNVATLNHQHSAVITEDPYFREKSINYRQKLMKSFPKRKKRIDGRKRGLVDYDQASCFRKILGEEDTDWPSVLSDVCHFNNLTLDYKIMFDCPAAEEVKRLQAKFDVFEKLDKRSGFKDETALLTVTGEQVRETELIDNMEFKFLMAKNTIQICEWHGLIPKIDYRNWDVIKPVIRQKMIFTNREKLENAGNISDTSNSWAELEDDSDDEDDIEFFVEENAKNNNNFYFHFRKEGKSKEPVLDENNLKPKDHFEYFPPFLIPNSHLDFKTWKSVGFDGKRNQAPKQIKVAGTHHKNGSAYFRASTGVDKNVRTVQEINAKLEGRTWKRPVKPQTQRNSVENIKKPVNHSENLHLNTLPGENPLPNLYAPDLDLLASNAFSTSKRKKSNFHPGYRAVSSVQSKADDELIRKNTEQYHLMQKRRRNAEVSNQVRAMNKLKNRDVQKTMFEEAIESFSPVQCIFDTTDLPSAYHNPSSKHFEVNTHQIGNSNGGEFK